MSSSYEAKRDVRVKENRAEMERLGIKLPAARSEIAGRGRKGSQDEGRGGRVGSGRGSGAAGAAGAATAQGPSSSAVAVPPPPRPFDWDPLYGKYVGREEQLDQLRGLFGASDHQVPPFLGVAGPPATGKTAILREAMSDKPHVFVNCVECFSPKFLLDIVVEQLGALKPSDAASGSSTRCTTMHELAKYITQWCNVRHPDDPHVSHKMQRIKGRTDVRWSLKTTYLVFDHAECLRRLPPSVIPALVRLPEQTRANLCVIFITDGVWDSLCAVTRGFSPIVVHFPQYDDDTATQILCNEPPPPIADVGEGWGDEEKAPPSEWSEVGPTTQQVRISVCGASEASEVGVAPSNEPSACRACAERVRSGASKQWSGLGNGVLWCGLSVFASVCTFLLLTLYASHPAASTHPSCPLLPLAPNPFHFTSQPPPLHSRPYPARSRAPPHAPARSHMLPLLSFRSSPPPCPPSPLAPVSLLQAVFSRFIKLVCGQAQQSCRDLRELRYLTHSLFPVYMAPVADRELSPIRDADRLRARFMPHLQHALSGIFGRTEAIRTVPVAGSAQAAAAASTAAAAGNAGGARGAGAAGAAAQQRAAAEGRGRQKLLELPLCTKVLLIAAFLASHNPKDTDIRFFSAAATGQKSRKRKGRSIAQQVGRGGAARGGAARGPRGARAFELERLLAIFNALLTHLDDPDDASKSAKSSTKSTFPFDLYAQIASLVRLKLLEQPSQAMDLDQVKYRCNVGQALVKALAAGAELDLSKFLYDEEQV